MAAQLDWTTWLLAAAVCVLFLWFFFQVGASLLAYSRSLIGTIQNWPQIRRAMVDAEARAGGRYPLWFRLVRSSLIIAMIALVAFLLWHRFR